jgi:hypothetical protein
VVLCDIARPEAPPPAPVAKNDARNFGSPRYSNVDNILLSGKYSLHSQSRLDRPSETVDGAVRAGSGLTP